ncbi:Fur family transcriptional regulator [Anthocerotibacter panamensis]|uniref:Fur family transcriptional regulator n=1 Tax=Anthocerotibacter panamensis TaxID=2857077 RepID=UPI001C406478|nr:transcriptional repressor [Anthocerotibacter panamensis]
MDTQQRWTRGQKTVLEVLQGKEHLLSAQQIYTQLRDTPQEVGLATVYRALEMLVTRGRIQAISIGEDQQTYYQIKGSHRHGSHHLICRVCKRVVPLPACPVGELEHQLSRQHHFTIDYHVLDFFGLCHACAALP